METTQKAPWWGWLFAGVCASIPIVALGGAIPSGLGAMGAALCYGISRDGKGSSNRRVIQCFLVSCVCWGLFGALASVVISHAQSPSAPTSLGPARAHAAAKATQPRELTQEDERKIYAKAARRRDQIAASQERLEKRRESGGPTSVLEAQVEHAEKMYENHLAFSARFSRITPQKLQAIIERGDAEGWAWE